MQNNNSVELSLCFLVFFVAGLLIATSINTSDNTKIKFVLGLSTGISSKNNGNSNLTLLYEFPDLGLKIKYPNGWEKIEYGRAVKAFGEGVIVNFLSPLEGKSDKFREFVQVRIENLSSGDLGKIQANSSIGDNPMYEMVFDHPNLANRSDIITTLSEWSPLNGKALVIEFSAEKSEFTTYLPLAHKIMDSIEINGAGISSTANQSKQPESSILLSQNELNAANLTTNNTQTSSIIKKLLERGIDLNETNFESQGKDQSKLK